MPKEAIEASKSGNFRAAGRLLSAVALHHAVSDPQKRLSVAKELFNPVTLAKLGDINADDAGLVDLYDAMKECGILQLYGSAPVATTSATPKEKAVSVQRLVSQAGLPLEALSPKRSNQILWQLSGVGLVAAIVLTTRRLGVESLAGPIILSLGAGFVLDQSLLRGSIFETIYGQISPNYSERILKHEAGHLLVGYLSGLSISGYILSGRESLKNKLPAVVGQGGTLFYDAQLNAELKSGQLTSRTIDQWTVVVMAGIAAEAIEYGRAEGGAGDETSLVRLLGSLKPPWGPERIKAQARWAVLQAIMLLRANRQAYEAVVELMRERRPLGDCIACIERLCKPTRAANRVPITTPTYLSNVGNAADKHRDLKDAESIAEREQQIIAELAKVKAKLDALEGPSK